MDNVLKNFINVAEAIKDQNAELESWKSEALMLRRVLAQSVLTNGVISVDPKMYVQACSKMDGLELGNSKVCFVGDNNSLFKEIK